jgi:hypothetical protein
MQPVVVVTPQVSDDARGLQDLESLSGRLHAGRGGKPRCGRSDDQRIDCLLHGRRIVSARFSAKASTILQAAEVVGVYLLRRW